MWDLQARYTRFRYLTASFGVRNHGQRFQAGIDPTYTDLRDRMYYGAIRYTFKCPPAPGAEKGAASEAGAVISRC